MFSRILCITFLTISLSSFTAHGAPAQQQQRQKEQSCTVPPPQTVFRTVTVNPQPTPTGRGLINGGGNGKNNGNATKAPPTNTVGTGNGTKGEPTATSSVTPPKGGTGGGRNNNNGGNNLQTSLTLDPRVIATGFENNGQDVPTAGQVASLTSKNNFINFCLTVSNLPITNGKQITTGSCNPAPIGTIPSTGNMPSAKFAFPANFGTIKANTAFTIKMNIRGMQTGAFVNAQQNYFAAPQQLNKQGQIIGHSHVVVEQLTALDQTSPTDPRKFAFFKGLNAAAQNGQLTADVTNGLPAGFYKLSSINTAANHQPVIVPVAQHGSLDDAIYFTVTNDGKAFPASGSSGGKIKPSPAGTTPTPSKPASKSIVNKAAPTGTGSDTPTPTLPPAKVRVVPGATTPAAANPCSGHPATETPDATPTPGNLDSGGASGKKHPQGGY